MKRVLSVCLLLALCLGLYGCDMTFDVQDTGSANKGSTNFWKKEEKETAPSETQAQSAQQQEQAVQTQPQQQQQYVPQGNTYVPAVTRPSNDYYTDPYLQQGNPALPYTDTPNLSYDSSLEYWITYCDTKYMDESYLYGMTKAECRIARNAVYAKSGRIFTSDDLATYFSYYSWYIPRIHPDNFSKSMLNAVQEHNLNVVIAYEKTLG